MGKLPDADSIDSDGTAATEADGLVACVCVKPESVAAAVDDVDVEGWTVR